MSADVSSSFASIRAITSPEKTIAAQEELDFAEVYQENFAYVYRLVGRLAGSAQPDDLAQDVFVVVHRRLHEFDGRAALTTWLFRIAYRVVGAHVRQERRRRELGSLLLRGQRKVANQKPSSLEDAQMSRQLRECIDRLSWKKRAVLILHDVEDWTAPAIASELGVSVNTVYSRLRAARSEMAAQWSRLQVAQKQEVA